MIWKKDTQVNSH